MSKFDLGDKYFILCGLNMIIKDNSLKFGLCVIDNYTNNIYIEDFTDNDFFTNIENLLIQLAPAHEETVFYVIANFPYEFYSQKFACLVEKIELIDGKEVYIDNKVFVNKKFEYVSTIKEILDEEDFNNNILIKQDQCIDGLDTLNATIEVTRLLQYEQYRNKYTLSRYRANEYMGIDINCIKNLNIIDNLEDKKAIHLQKLNRVKTQNINTRTSVYGILNACCTKFGSRMLRTWILQPLQNVHDIQLRLDVVELFLSNMSYRNEIRKYLSKIDDIQSVNMSLCKYISKKDHNVVKLVDLAKLLGSIKVTKELFEYLKLYEGVNQEILYTRYNNRLDELLKRLVMLEEMLNSTIIFDNTTREYIINYDLNNELKATHQKIDECMSEIQEEKIKAVNILQVNKDPKVDIQEYQTHGYVLSLNKINGENLLKHTNSGFKLITSNKNHIIVNNDRLVKLSKQIKEYRAEYKQKELVCLKKIIDVTSTYYPLFERLTYILSEIDVLASYAHIIENNNQTYVKPIFTDQKRLILKDSRHLVLEWNEDIIRKNNPNNKNLISNDCVMESDSNIKLITGINMGGKSTYLRQVGICVLLAHIGCYVPASYAELPIIDQIYTRVGAGDNMLKGVSTYMNEMLEVCSLIKTATTNSLLLIDELGRGTSTDDGIGISYGILDHIARVINPFCLFATHFYELTEMEKVYFNLKNYYVSYSVTDDGELLMEYKIVRGNCSKSFGVKLFNSLKFDKETCCTLEKYLN
jgi:DNA mismatch repair protein MSH2